MEEIRKLVKNKLALVDMANRDSKGEPRAITKWQHELFGMKQALQALGIKLILDVNPYYHEDGMASTFKLRIEGEEEWQ